MSLVSFARFLDRFDVVLDRFVVVLDRFGSFFVVLWRSLAESRDSHAEDAEFAERESSIKSFT